MAATETPVYEVGKYYTVPVARMRFDDGAERQMPVQLPMHIDAEIGFPYRHYHYDWRFASAREFRSAVNARGGPQNTVLALDYRDAITWEARPRTDLLELTITMKRLLCKRPIPAWPSHEPGKVFRAKAEALCEGKTLKPGLICPHKGADLSHCPPDENGVVECPMHGVRWNVHTGQMVRSNA